MKRSEDNHVQNGRIHDDFIHGGIHNGRIHNGRIHDGRIHGHTMAGYTMAVYTMAGYTMAGYATAGYATAGYTRMSLVEILTIPKALRYRSSDNDGVMIGSRMAVFVGTKYSPSERVEICENLCTGEIHSQIESDVFSDMKKVSWFE